MAQSAQLPTLDFFAQGNVMTGSCTPEQMVGELKANIFNYRAKCDSIDGEKKIVAEYYIGFKCFALTAPESIISRPFELTQQGVDEAQSWLTEEYVKYLRSL